MKKFTKIIWYGTPTENINEEADGISHAVKLKITYIKKGNWYQQIDAKILNSDIKKKVGDKIYRKIEKSHLWLKQYGLR